MPDWKNKNFSFGEIVKVKTRLLSRFKGVVQELITKIWHRTQSSLPAVKVAVGVVIAENKVPFFKYFAKFGVHGASQRAMGRFWEDVQIPQI